ncbi:MAG: hypothetical protein ACHQ6U_01180 [Thermodesulfobacteriota bacterium]
MNTHPPIYERYSRIIIAVLLCVSGFLVYFFTQPHVPDPFNYFNYLADAFLHGRVYVTVTPSYFEELIVKGGKSYVIYPPMPAIVLMPFIALCGISFKQVFLSFFLGGLNISIVYLLMRKVTEDEDIQFWMAVLFGFGTIHWYTATVGSVWFFSHIVSMTFLLLAIYGTFGGWSALLIGLLLGASYWSRLTTILTFPFFIIMLSDRWLLTRDKGGLFGRMRVSPLILFCSGVGIFVLLNFAYNYVRFGSLLDTAYVLHTISPAKEKVSPWFNKGLFSFSYIPYHLRVFLLEPPVFIKIWPYVIPSKVGLSILITTPAFVFALFAARRKKLILACWSAIILTAFLIFIKSGTGWAQFGYRYALDFYPFLLLLTVTGIGEELKWYHKVLILLSVLVNIWGVLFLNKFDWYKLY